MKITRLGVLLVILVLAVLLKLFFVSHYGGKYGATPVISGVSQVKPAAPVVRIKAKARGMDAAKTVVSIEKLMKRRAKRVSRLREPGEAMGGGRDKQLESVVKNVKAQKQDKTR